MYTLDGNVPLKAGFADGENGWGDEMNANLELLAGLSQITVIGRVAAAPSSADYGEMVILTDGAHDNEIGIYTQAGWVYVLPVEGWIAWDRATDELLVFRPGAGRPWQVFQQGGGGGGGGIEEAPEDGKQYGRQDGEWTEIEAGGGGGGAATWGFGKHRYWRINATSQAGNYIHFFEIEMRSTPGGPDQCNGGTPLQSGSYQGRNAENAFNNSDTGTAWESNDNGRPFKLWIGYDFGAGNEKEIVEMRLYNQPGYTPTEEPLYHSFQFSDDGINWTEAWAATIDNWNAPGERISTAPRRSVSGGGGGGGGGFTGRKALTPPLAAQYPTRIIANNTTLDVTDNADIGLVLDGGVNVPGDRFRGCFRPIVDPAANFIFEAYCRPTMINGNYTSAGIALRESATQKIIMFRLSNSGVPFALSRVKQTTENTYAGDDTYPGFNMPEGFMRVRRDGNFYRFEISRDGINYITIGSDAVTNFATAQFDQIGFGIITNRGEPKNRIYLNVPHQAGTA